MDAFRNTFPMLCELLEGTSFDNDAMDAAELAKSEEDIKAAFESRVFSLNQLMWLLSGAVVPQWANSEASQLESDLATIVGTVGMAAARAAYRDKFLVEAKCKTQNSKDKTQDAKNKLEDVRYEIAVTARACAVFDADSIQLEKLIPDSTKDKKNWKNSDVYGTIQGKPVRIEVTVLHEELPPAIHLELDDFVRQSEISSGFEITLRSALVDLDYAERVRALIELLHENQPSDGDSEIVIDGVLFRGDHGAYECPQETAPFESVCFYAASEFQGAEKLRNIIHPCISTPVTPLYLLEDSPNPPWVKTSADLPDAPTQVPVSTKIRQMLAGKLQQCEEDVINIIAFGNPLPMHDNEVDAALLGPLVVQVGVKTNENGSHENGEMFVSRGHKAPFAPQQFVPNKNDLTEFIDPFRRLSAVWHVRLGAYAKSVVIPNPNAFHPAPLQIVTAFSDSAANTEVGIAAQRVSQISHWNESRIKQSESLSYEIIWTEMAQNYVFAFKTLEEARAELEKVALAGFSLDDLRQKLNNIGSEPSTDDNKTKFISPTNEELAMTFVIDCGGYEQAKSCLNEYAADRDGGVTPR